MVDAAESLIAIVCTLATTPAASETTTTIGAATAASRIDRRAISITTAVPSAPTAAATRAEIRTGFIAVRPRPCPAPSGSRPRTR